MMNEMKARIIALYLPQFHPIPENDEWWGKGFTEWTNVAKAKPLFKGHLQPRIPADLGFYDLRLPQVRSQQAIMAKDAGIEGFCYYHYWFAGKQLLETPFNEVVSSGEPDFPFCLCWANHTWSNKTWEKSSFYKKDSTLIKQTYPGDDDNVMHFLSLLSAFRDKRYMRIDGKLIFVIYDPISFVNVAGFMNTWQSLAKQYGLPGFYFIGMVPSTLTFSLSPVGSRHRVLPNLKSSSEIFNYVLSLGFDAVNSFGKRRGEMLYEGTIKNIIKKVMGQFGIRPNNFTYDYEKTVKNYFAPEDSWETVFPTIVPQWDRTPRLGKAEGVYINATPEKFQRHIEQALNIIKDKQQEHKVIFMKSWNEWGEGNYVEPDIYFGDGFLKAIKNSLIEQ